MEKKQQKGFAVMGTEQRKEIASAGGRAAHEQGRAHQFTAEEARAAGKKGAAARAENRAKSAS